MIEKICKNCRFLREMKGPYDTDNYHYCDYGNLAPDVKIEGKCIQIIPDAFEPLDGLLLRQWKQQQSNKYE